jgi:integrase
MKGHIQQRGKRSRGDGGIDQRGENVFRLRYRVDGRRFAKTFHGTHVTIKIDLIVMES